jgi:UPF0755 protein
MHRHSSPLPNRSAGWIGKVLLLLIIVAAGAAAYAWHDYTRFASTPLSNSEPVVLEVKPGDSLRTIVANLAQLELTEDWRRPWWQAVAWQADIIHRLQAGEYAIEPGLTPRALLDKLASGRVIQYSFTLVEGWNFAQLRQALAGVANIDHSLADQSDSMIMTALGAEGQHPEGWFLPETYAYTRGASDMDLLKRAHQAMKTELDRVWASRKPATAVGNDYHALILASIIEKETGVPGERRRIAGVFTRRLEMGMRLQTDPTVIYGVGSAYDGNLRRRDLDTDTPYNTYTRTGLPPTPIAMPGRAALEAAVDPADGRELYFVSRGDGSHHFSESYAEHLGAVRRYQLGARRQALDPAAGRPVDGSRDGNDDDGP